MKQEALTLFDLNALVRRSLEQCLPDEYWIQAELSDVRSNSTGHCYLEFIQKDSRSNNLIAKARGMIWGNIFRLLKPYFEEATGQMFGSGIKVLVKVTVQFHELYGYSLTVLDIDPTYTLGDMARRRREILQQLEEDGVLTGFRFRGGGFGHGAGMSQNGANHMAEEGKTYEEILDLFYEGARVSQI